MLPKESNSTLKKILGSAEHYLELVGDRLSQLGELATTSVFCTHVDQFHHLIGQQLALQIDLNHRLFKQQLTIESLPEEYASRVKEEDLLKSLDTNLAQRCSTL